SLPLFAVGCSASLPSPRGVCAPPALDTKYSFELENCFGGHCSNERHSFAPITNSFTGGQSALASPRSQWPNHSRCNLLKSSAASGPKSMSPCFRAPSDLCDHGPTISIDLFRANSLAPLFTIAVCRSIEPLQWSYQPQTLTFGTMVWAASASSF